MILLSTGSLYLFGTQRVFELAAQAGYEGIEVLIDNRADTWQADYLTRLAAEYGLSIPVLHSPFKPNKSYWPAADEGQCIQRTVRLAEELGAETVVVHLPVRWHYSLLINSQKMIPLPHFWRKDSHTADWFEHTLPRLQAETSVAIAVEIMPIRHLFGIWPFNAHYWNTLSEWVRFDHLTLDTTHCGTWGVDPLKAFKVANGRVSHIHLSNFDGREHRLPQQGNLSLDQFLGQVTAAGYRGHITVETSPEAMECEDIERVRANLADSLAFVREHLQN